MVDNFWILVTQVCSILVYVGVAFGLYRLLAAQKDATIQAKDATIENLEKRLNESESNLPDVLVEQLESRLEVAKREIARLKDDTKRPLSEIESLRKKQEVTSEVVVNLLNTIKVFQFLSNFKNKYYNDFVIRICGGMDDAVKTILSAGTIADLAAQHGKTIRKVHGGVNQFKDDKGGETFTFSWTRMGSPTASYKIFEDGRIVINNIANNEFIRNHNTIRNEIE